MKLNSIFLLSLVLATPLATQAQFYGLIDNHQGTTQRYPTFVNLTSKDGFTQNVFPFSGGGAGFGAGEAANVGPDGAGDTALDGGGALNGGFLGVAYNMNTPLNLTTVSNGRQNTRLTVDFMNQQATTGDTFFIRLETGDFTNSKTFTIPVPAGNTAWNTYSFDLATDGVVNGGFNLANVTGVVFTATDNGDFAFRLDNLGFTGNYEPTSGAIENFQGYTAQSLAAGAGALPSLNDFDGAIETFAFGAGSVTATELVDLGAGDIAVRYTFSNTEGGIVFDLGLPGAVADLTNYGSLEIDLAVGQAGDAVSVLVEDVNAIGYGDRCAATPAVTTSLQTFSFDLNTTDFTCGQGLDKTQIHRVTVLPTVDQGNGITITIDDVRFVPAPTASVESWTQFEK